MSIITLPSCPPLNGVNWRYNQPTQVNRSEWTNKRKVSVLPAAPMWMADVQDIVITEEWQYWEFNAFFGLLQGRANSFRLPAVRKAQISGVTPLVNGGGQTGYSIITDGWGASGTKLKRGQFITISDQLMRLTADVVSASGAATLTFDRWLRASPADNAALVVDIPTALVSLADDTTTIMDNSTTFDETGEGDWIIPAFSVEEAF